MKWTVLVLLGFGVAFGITEKIEPLSSGTRLTLQIKPSTLKWERISAAGQTFSRLKVEEGLSFKEVGFPEIPVLYRWVVVDPRRDYTIRYTSDEGDIVQSVLMYPTQPDYPDTGAKYPFHYNRLAYLSSQWRGSDYVELGERIDLGAFTLLQLKITPIHYQALTRTVRVLREVQVDILPDGDGVEEFVPSGKYVTHFAKEQISKLAINGGEVIKSLPEGSKAMRLLIVTSPILRGVADKIAELSYHVATDVLVETVENMTSAQLKAKISQVFTATPVDSILLVGDEKHLPLYSSGGTPGDVTYALLSGNDSVIDAAIGRLPVSDLAEAEYFFKKLESHFWWAAQSHHKRVMLMAHKENYPGKYTANQEEIRGASNPLGLDYRPQYGGNQATNASVLSLLKEPYAVVNYRGHGSQTAWTGWDSAGKSFGFNEVLSISSGPERMAVFFNIACDNGAIQSSSDSIAEKQLLGNLADPFAGGIASIAATQPSATETNHRFDKYLFQYIQDTDRPQMGSVMTLANNKLIRDSGGSMPGNVKMYLLLGHPLTPIAVK